MVNTLGFIQSTNAGDKPNPLLFKPSNEYLDVQ